MEKIKVVMKESYVGTSLQGYVDVSYGDLVKVFGEPNSQGDDYKVDAEWNGTINDLAFTIYNYKDGKNYVGAKGKKVEDIRDWHIGGKSLEVVQLVNDYIFEQTKKEA